MKRIHHQRALHGNETAQPGIAAFQFLHHQPVLHVAHPGAAVAREIRAQKAHFGHLRNQFFRKPGVAEAVAQHRRDTLVHEPARGLAHHQLLFGEL